MSRFEKQNPDNAIFNYVVSNYMQSAVGALFVIFSKQKYLSFGNE